MGERVEGCELCRLSRIRKPVYRDSTCTIVKREEEYLAIFNFHGRPSGLQGRLLRAVIYYLFDLDGGVPVLGGGEHTYWRIVGARYLGMR